MKVFGCWLVAILCFWSVESVFQPTTKAELQTAVDAWCAAATPTEGDALSYGPISGWDMSLTTDWSFLFEGKATCNPDIRKWNTDKVVHFENMFEGATSFCVDLTVWDLTEEQTNSLNRPYSPGMHVFMYV